MPSPINKSEIIRDSANQEAMIRKLESQYKEKESKHLSSIQATSVEEAIAKTADTINRRRNERLSPDYQPLKHTAKIIEPQSKEAKLMKEQILNQEATTSPSLKGRVTRTNSPQS